MRRLKLSKELIDLLLEKQKEYMDRVYESETERPMDKFTENDLLNIYLDIYESCKSIVSCGENVIVGNTFYVGNLQRSTDPIKATTLDDYEFFGHVKDLMLEVSCVLEAGEVVWGTGMTGRGSDELRMFEETIVVKS